MKVEAKALIRKLWSDPDHRKAMQLIIECIPTPRKLWEAELVRRIQAGVQTFGMQFNKDENVEFYPNSSTSPREIKIYFTGDVAERTAQFGFHLCYMLHCRDQAPDIGSEFCLRLMAWCESQQARGCLPKLALEKELPPSAPRKNWSSWENIWTGGSYTLRNFDDGDVEGMAKLFGDGARGTYPLIVGRVAQAGKKK